MSAIRPLTRDDLPGAVALYAEVVHAGPPPAGLAGQFERTLFGHPWVDEEIPSLVYDDPQHGIVAFLGSHVRRMRTDGRDLRIGCSGQLVARQGSGPPGVGALLLRRYLSGPQDLSTTDGANDTVRVMWERLGGLTAPTYSMGWTRVLRPAGFAVELAARRRPYRAAGAAAHVARMVDSGAIRIAASGLAAATPQTSDSPLGADELLDALERLPRSYRLRPAYDRPFLEWLFAEATAVAQRGELRRRVVRAPDGSLAGWYVLYIKPGGISSVLQVGALARQEGAVLDHLIDDARRAGSVAVQGRVEAPLLPALVERRCLFRRSEWALLHSSDTDVLAAIAYGGALLTRLEGEWWMGHHLRPPGAPGG